MKTLITGGTTWFGQSIVQRLLLHDHDIVSFDESPAPWSGGLKRPVKVYRGSVSDLGALTEVVRTEKPDVIIHRDVLYGNETEERYLRTVKMNLIGALHVFEIAALVGIRRVVYESAIGVYGVQEDHGEQAITEEDAMFKNLSYAFRVTQFAVEFFAPRYRQKTGVEIVGVRPSVCHSPQKDVGYTRWSNDFVTFPAIGKPMHFPYPAEQRTSLLWVDDAAEVYARLADKPTLKYDMYNTGGHDVSNQELAQIVKNFIPDAQFSFADSGSQPLSWRISNNRAKEDLDFELRPLSETILEHANLARKLYRLPPLK